MLRLHNEILGHFEKKRPTTTSELIMSKSVTDHFSKQLQHANKKLEEFILMLLDSFNLSEGAAVHT